MGGGKKRKTRVNLNGGQIYTRTNFLPITEADINLLDYCCNLDNCFVEASFLPDIPKIARMFITEQAYYSAGDLITIYAQFSTPVVVIGNLRLRLRIIQIGNSI